MARRTAEDASGELAGLRKTLEGLAKSQEKVIKNNKKLNSSQKKVKKSFKDQLPILQRLKNILLGVVGAHKKLAHATMLGVRNQRNFNKETKSFGGTLSVWRSKLLIASFGVGLVQKAVSGLVNEYVKYQGAQSRVNAALKSTGFVSGQSAKGLNKLATEIQKNTGVSDTLTLSSSALLTTFTQIGGETFPTAQKAIIDMTAAMNAGQVTQEGLRSSTIQVGKALNDPIKGITALSRVGVIFTQKQKDLIKAHVNSGQVAKAQAIILKELNKEFGDIASADSYEKSLRQLDSAFGDLQKDIGLGLIPVFEIFIGQLERSITLLSANKRAIAEYTVSIGFAVGALKALQKWFVFSAAAAAANTTKLALLGKVATKLFSRTIIGVGIVALGFLIKKLVESTGIFGGLDKAVEDTNDSIDDFNTMIQSMKLSELNSELLVSTSLLEMYKDELKDITDISGLEPPKLMGQLTQELDAQIDALGITRIAYGVLNEEIKNSSPGNFARIIELTELIKKEKENEETILARVEALKKEKEVLISDRVVDLTKKYQDQKAVLLELHPVKKELLKIAQKEGIQKEELLKALDDETHKYHELAKAVKGVVNMKNLEQEIKKLATKFKDQHLEMLTAAAEAEIAIQDKIMNNDIADIKKSSDYKRAQKRGDDKEMARLEAEARKKSLPERDKAFKAKRNVALSGVWINTSLAIMKAFADYGWPLGLIPAALLGALGSQQAEQIKSQPGPKFAQGGDFITSGSQNITVGDNPGGRERVSITPLSSPNIAGPTASGPNVTVNVSGNVMTQDFVEDELAEAIREAARRGTDFGIS